MKTWEIVNAALWALNAAAWCYMTVQWKDSERAWRVQVEAWRSLRATNPTQATSPTNTSTGSIDPHPKNEAPND